MIHPAYRMGGCSGRIWTFAYAAETFRFSLALKPLHFIRSVGGCTARISFPRDWLEPAQQRWSWCSFPRLHREAETRESCSQPGWRMALDPLLLLQAKLGQSCCLGISLGFGIRRAGKYRHRPTAEAGPRHGKGKRREQDWVKGAASGKETGIGQRGDWLYLRANPG